MSRTDGFEVRNITYFPGYEKKRERRFDVVKWDTCEPTLVTTRGGQMKWITEYCYSVANLIWNPEEKEFDLVSIGLRFPESHPSAAAMDMICKFAREKEREYLDDEED